MKAQQVRPLARMWHDLAGVVCVSRASDGGVWLLDEVGATALGPCEWTPVARSWRTMSARCKEACEDRHLLEAPRSVAVAYAHPR